MSSPSNSRPSSPTSIPEISVLEWAIRSGNQQSLNLILDHAPDAYIVQQIDTRWFLECISKRVCLPILQALLNHPRSKTRIELDGRIWGPVTTRHDIEVIDYFISFVKR